MLKDKKYCDSFRDCPCLIHLLGLETTEDYCSPFETVCGHHLDTRLRDDRQIPLGYKHHTGNNGVHVIGKKTWHDKYLSKEECIELAEFAYGFWKTNGVNLFSLDNVKEVITLYFKED